MKSQEPRTTYLWNGVATSSSPFQSLFHDDEDVAPPKPFLRGQCPDAPKPDTTSESSEPYPPVTASAAQTHWMT
jgi:hypothetical protein